MQTVDEGARRAALEAAERKALSLFDAIEAAGFDRDTIQQNYCEHAFSSRADFNWVARICGP